MIRIHRGGRAIIYGGHAERVRERRAHFVGAALGLNHLAPARAVVRHATGLLAEDANAPSALSQIRKAQNIVTSELELD